MAITQRLTLEDFRALPEQKPALELEPDGRVIQKVSPQGQHSRIQLALCELINRFAEGRRRALALPELRANFAGASYVPDVAVYAWNRIPRTADSEVANRFDIPPDLAIEIASPEQSPNALIRKCAWYVENGVERALLIDPADRSVIRFARGEPPRAAREAELLDLGSALHGLHLTVDEVFATLRIPR